MIMNQYVRFDDIKKSYCLSYMESKLNVNIIQNEKSFLHILSFFLTYFNFEKQNDDEISLGNMFVYSYKKNIKNINLFLENKNKKNILIKKSKEAIFNISADLFECDDWNIYRYIETHTIVCFNKTTQNILLFMDKTSEIPIVELLRDLFYKDQENKGCVFLHAAAVEKNNKVIIISGNKGAGKSTLMLKLIYDSQCKMVTGDKLLLKIVDGKLIAKGWPDYPHLGIGTIKSFKMISRIFKQKKSNSLPDNAKFLFEPRTFYRKAKIPINPQNLEIGKIICPSFNVNDIPTVTFLNNCLNSFLENNIEFKINDEYCKWHNYLDIYSNTKKTFETYSKKLESVEILDYSGNFYKDKENIETILN